MLLPNARGSYSFIRGISPYSGGVIATPGFSIEHVRLSRPAPWRDGFERIDAHLREAGRPRAALCAIALRSPAPFTFGGFQEFNAGYVEVLKSWDLMVDGLNPVARTNVAPEVDPPGEPSLYSFAFTVPSDGSQRSFVVAGGGELPEGSRTHEEIIRRGDTSPGALAEKTRFVLGLMQGRLQTLGVTWDDVSVTNIYTVHDLNALLAPEILPRMGAASWHGIVWHYTRPPIVDIEYEMDLRGGTTDTVIRAQVIRGDSEIPPRPAPRRP
jgi:hypothetical protein